ncbi:cytochrome P450 [Mycena olivaceomarginata]|nr:cytochrome P450 [Mycena olivaceomarginata]
MDEAFPQTDSVIIFDYNSVPRHFQVVDQCLSILRGTLATPPKPIPGALTLYVQYRAYVDRREAAARGEILPPEMKASFGGVSTVRRSVEDPRDWIPRGRSGTAIFTCEPQYIKAILSTQFTSFEKGPALRHIFNPLLGTGVFAADGSMWKFHRDMTSHRISDFDQFDTHELMGRVTLDSASAFLFGHDFRSLAEPLSYPFHVPRDSDSDSHSVPSFTSAFLEAQNITNIRMRYLDFWPLAEFWKTRSRSRCEHQNAARRAAQYLCRGSRHRALVLPPFSIYMLAEHPDVLAKLCHEVFERLGEKGRPTVEDIKEMKHLRAVLNGDPMNVCTSIEGVVLPPIKPGRSRSISHLIPVPYAPIVMHRRKDLWGPDALEFDPDRFIDERLNKFLVPNPFIFLPFNGGPRICLGQQFAYQEASFILIRVVQAFSKFSLAPTAARVVLAGRLEDG